MITTVHNPYLVARTSLSVVVKTYYVYKLNLFPSPRSIFQTILSLAMSDGPVHRVISAAEVYSFPQGHLGHLSDVEANALDEFRTLCTEKNLYTGTKKYDFGSPDDTTLLFVKSLWP